MKAMLVKLLNYDEVSPVINVQLIFIILSDYAHKVASNKELADTKPLLLGEIQS